MPASSSQITVSSSPKPSSSIDDMRTRCCGRVPPIGSRGSADGDTSLTAHTRSRQRTTWPSSGTTTSVVSNVTLPPSSDPYVSLHSFGGNPASLNHTVVYATTVEILRAPVNSDRQPG